MLRRSGGLLPAGFHLREHGSEGPRRPASEIGTPGQLCPGGRRTGEAAEIAGEGAWGGERGVFLEDERADFLGVGGGERRDR